MIDSHAHLISDDQEQYPQLASDARIARAATDGTMTAEQLLDDMDRNGVTHAAIVQRGSIYGFDNSYVCDSACRYPDRLAAVCSIDTSLKGSGDSVFYWVQERGAVGIRLMELVPGAGTIWLDGSAALDAWAAAAELGIPVCVHFFPWNRIAGLTRLSAILKAFPKLNVVVDHLGAISGNDEPPHFGVDALLENLAPFEGVTLKFTTIPLGRLYTSGIGCQPLLRHIADIFGVQRMLWGSDITQSPGSYAHMTLLARQAVSAFKPSEQDELLAGTSRRLYGKAWLAPARQPAPKRPDERFPA